MTPFLDFVTRTQYNVDWQILKLVNCVEFIQPLHKFSQATLSASPWSNTSLSQAQQSELSDWQHCYRWVWPKTWELLERSCRYTLKCSRLLLPSLHTSLKCDAIYASLSTQKKVSFGYPHMIVQKNMDGAPQKWILAQKLHYRFYSSVARISLGDFT